MVFKQQTFHEELPVVEQENPQTATLETAVSDALATAGGVDAADVTVIAEGTTIILGGTVFSAPEIARAEEVARSVSGVTDVRNEIRAEA